MNRLRIASFHIRATMPQSVRWKIAAESEGYASVGQWLAAAADSYLRVRARAGLPVPLAWRRGRFRVLLDGEALEVTGHTSPPLFGAFRGDGTGRGGRFAHVFRLVYLPTGAVIASVHHFREVKALAGELARRWTREQTPEPPTL